MAKKRGRKKHPLFRAAPEPLIEGVAEAESLAEEGRWDEACEVLEELDESYPNRVEVLGELVNVYGQLEDAPRLQQTCERLAKLVPPDPELMLILATAYLLNFYPALALKSLRRFLEQWPKHEEADRVRRQMVGLSATMDELLSQLGEQGVEGLEIAALHEEARSMLEQGRYAQGRKVGEKLLSLRPNFVPALNNLSQIYFIEGQPEQAFESARRVLELDSENFHAHANLTRYLFLSGHADEAREQARQLKALRTDSVDAWVKKAETFSYLGDDKGVEEVFKEAERADSVEEPFLWHLAAVAAMRLGREAEARKRWRRALKLAPGFDLAEENLADLSLPAGERHAPWPFDLGNWVRQKTLGELIKIGEPGGKPSARKAFQRAMRNYLNQHPELVLLIPILLDRGDPEGREFAMHLATLAETPETLAMLRDFALGQRGPDQLRLEAANAASGAGLFPDGKARLWMGGEWRDLLLFGFELHDEPVRKHRPNVERLALEVIDALRENNPVKAERIIKQALELEPDAPDLLNNLALAYSMQGRDEESLALTHEIHRLHPDYLFVSVALARLHTREGRLDEAEALLQPILSRKRLHFSEHAALCQAQIELFIAQGNEDAARSWLEMWREVDPEHPDIALWSLRLSKSLKEKLTGLGSLIVRGRGK